MVLTTSDLSSGGSKEPSKKVSKKKAAAKKVDRVSAVPVETKKAPAPVVVVEPVVPERYAKGQGVRRYR